MKAAAANTRLNAFLTLATFVLVVAVLKIAEEVLIPIALTVLLTFLLSPFVVRLTRWGFPRVIAIVITVTVAFGVMGGVGTLVVTQATGLLEELPKYEGNIRNKIASLKEPKGPDPLSRAVEMVKQLQRDLQAPRAQAETKRKSRDEPPHPVQVEVTQPEVTPANFALQFLSPVTAALGTAAIVIVFVVATLFQREDLRDRFIKVVSAGRLNLATQALDDAARRVTRYLLMQLVVNATYGIPVGVALHLIGVPKALLWGLLATLLRFIPFLGPWIAAAFPIALAAAVDPGWSMLLYTVALFIFMEVVSNNLVEPWLYGSSTGISNLALLVAAVFWTWLWGTPGLFLSTPLTVCIMVLGKYVGGLQFLSVLLGSQPVLDPAARFYQRMLSMDSDEVLDLAEKWTEERGIEGFYSEVFVPALYMSEEDRHAGALAEVRQKFILETSRELIGELERRPDIEEVEGNDTGPGAAARVTNGPPARPEVLVIPARDDADEVVGLVLRHLLKIHGHEGHVLPASSHLEDAIALIKEHDIDTVLISALPPAALVGARQLCRRLKENCPGVQLVMGVWTQDGAYNDIRLRLRRPKPDAIATKLTDALVQVESLLRGKEAPLPAEAHTGVPEREDVPPGATGFHEQIEPMGLAGVEPVELIATVVRDVAQHFSVPVSLVSVSFTEDSYWKAHAGVAPEQANTPPPENTRPLLAFDNAVVVEDVAKDRRYATDPSLIERGVKFLAGVPLRSKGGHVVGSLAVVDTKPRQTDERDRLFLEQRASELMEATERAGETSVTDVAAPAREDVP